MCILKLDDKENDQFCGHCAENADAKTFFYWFINMDWDSESYALFRANIPIGNCMETLWDTPLYFDENAYIDWAKFH